LKSKTEGLLLELLEDKKRLIERRLCLVLVLLSLVLWLLVVKFVRLSDTDGLDAGVELTLLKSETAEGVREALRRVDILVVGTCRLYGSASRLVWVESWKCGLVFCAVSTEVGAASTYARLTVSHKR
jgi:hypothetical protein